MEAKVVKGFKALADNDWEDLSDEFVVNLNDPRAFKSYELNGTRLTIKLKAGSIDIDFSEPVELELLDRSQLIFKTTRNGSPTNHS